MNKEFQEIIDRINTDKDMDKDMGFMLVPLRVSIPALLNLEARIDKIEKLLFPTTFEDMQDDIDNLKFGMVKE